MSWRLKGASGTATGNVPSYRPLYRTLLLVLSLTILPALALGRTTVSAATWGTTTSTHLTNIKARPGTSGSGVPRSSALLPGTPTNAKLTYTNGGPIMPTVKVYTIFWEPAGYSFDPTATNSTNPHCTSVSGDAAFECITNQFLQDLNGSSYYNTLTQYYQTLKDGTGRVNIQNSVTLGGTWVDTSPYPTSGCSVVSPYTACISDTQMDAEVAKGAQHFGGTIGGYTNLYVVFTPLKVDHCAFGDCADTDFCGYHDITPDPNNANNPLIFAYMFDEGNFSDFCGTPTSNGTSTGVTPNGDRYADSEVDTLAHEVAESANDPAANYSNFGGVAWFDNNYFGEIADDCIVYGTVDSTDGHNVILGGDKYIIQALLSNAGDGLAGGQTTPTCLLSYNPVSTLSLDSASDSATKGDNTTNATRPQLDGVGQPGVGITVKEGDASLCTTSTDVTGAWHCAPSTALTSAKHSIYVNAANPPGTATSNAQTLTIDTAIPTTKVTTATASSATIGVQDVLSGLANITVTKCANCTYTVNNTKSASTSYPDSYAFTGQTSQIPVTFTRINSSQSASIGLTSTDVAGNQADPTALFLGRSPGTQVAAIVPNVDQQESQIDVLNATPGITTLQVSVNGKFFQFRNLASGQTFSFSIASALQPGNANRIAVVGIGPQDSSATLFIGPPHQ
jgi:hypothetical protein